MTFINIGDETAPGDMIREVPYETRRRATTVDAKEREPEASSDVLAGRISAISKDVGNLNARVYNIEQMLITQADLILMLFKEREGKAAK